MTATRTPIVGLLANDLAEKLQAHQINALSARRIWRWVHNQGGTDFQYLPNFPQETRSLLAAHFTAERPSITRKLLSSDGTRKWLLQFSDGSQVESVFIPDGDRGSLCISTQVGCTLACKFCHTGTQPLVRNLRPQEIVGQVFSARDCLDEWRKRRDECRFTSIVFMGMGEPLFNYDNVAKATAIIMDPEGIAISRRKITLSTAGVVPMIEQAGRELGVNLAISLHAVRDELRNVLVPLNRKYPIAELLAACRSYPAANNARRILFEYVMLKDVNDRDAEARELVRLLKDIPAKVNLIPFNPWPGAPYECSTDERITAFARIIKEAGYSSPVRTPRGRDIFAACGQLKSETAKIRNR